MPKDPRPATEIVTERATARAVQRHARIGLALCAFLASAACARGRADVGVPMNASMPISGNSFVVRDVRVYDGVRTLERTHVVVRDGRVARVGGGRMPTDLPVVDGAGGTLIPGLIDAHAHVHTEQALRDGLRFGVTTQLDMLSRIAFARAHRPQADALSRTDMSDLFAAGSPITSARGMGSQFGIPFTTISGPEEADAFVRARLAEGSSHIKVLYEPDARIVSTISYETLRAVIAAARAQKAVSVVHISSLKGARDAVAAGADGLAHLFSDTVIDPAFARQIAERGMFVTATLSIFAAFDGSNHGALLAADARVAPYLTPAQRTALTKAGPGKSHPMASYLARFNLERGLENVGRLKAAGVRILAGDDAGTDLVAHGASLHGELQLLTRAGLTPAEAITAATRAPADAFGLTDRGRIVPSARADLMLVDGNPLQDITATRAIRRLFKNGFEVTRAIPPATVSPAPAPAAAPKAP